MDNDDHNPSAYPKDYPNLSADANPYWDYVEPECRWAPQCHRLLIPGGCDECESLNPNPDLPRDEVGELCAISDKALDLV